MHKSVLVLILGCLALSVGIAADRDPVSAETELSVKSPAIEDFRLPDHRGRSHQLRRYKDAKAVVLIYGGIGCPIVRQSIPEIKRLRDKYEPQGFVFLMVNANPEDDIESIAKEAEEYGIDLPILRDEVQAVTRMLGVERTADVRVIRTSDWRVAYRGPIDDRFDYGTAKPAPEHRWLDDALQALAEGRDAPVAEADVKGCRITLAPLPEEVSYTKHVAPLIQSKCARCHTEDSVAPFAFDDYKDVRNWTEMIREVVLTRRMPPWHAERPNAAFANDCSLTTEETRALLTWIDQGAPRGDGPDVLAEAADAKRGEWPLGPPDLVVSLPKAQELPAEGTFDYRYIVVPSGLEEDTWVRAVDVQPTNRRVVHHALVFILYPPELRHLQPEFHGGLEGYFAGYVPGQDPEPFPEGTGKMVPKGASFVFQMHYSATGRPETDQTRIGLYFAREKPKYELETRAAYNTELNIPAGDPDYTTAATHRVDRDVLLWSLSPHMHYRGSWFEYEARYPDGTSELLLSVPDYDFNWQTLYRFKEPKQLPAGTVVACRGGFDNSPRNPANPDPTKTVRFGEQTWDEMFIGYLDYAAVEGE
jgi:peroxiredoxin